MRQGGDVNIVGVVLTYVLTVYLLLLIGRLIFEMLQAYSRSWSPSGPLVLVAEIIYTATDPPLRFLRRHIRPLRIGSVALDISFMLLFLAILVLLSIARSL
jgi:YggT family protein